MAHPQDCPRCKSNRFVPMVESDTGLYWPKTLRTFRTVVNACVDCGHIEKKVDPRDMEKLQKQWQKKLGPQGPILR